MLALRSQAPLAAAQDVACLAQLLCVTGWLAGDRRLTGGTGWLAGDRRLTGGTGVSAQGIAVLQAERVCQLRGSPSYRRNGCVRSGDRLDFVRCGPVFLYMRSGV